MSIWRSDEAHRATGAYAYGNVVRHLMKFNPHFRVLALTATPGSTSEKVQEVIDNLHISVIEIRTEDALDIRQYVHKKVHCDYGYQSSSFDAYRCCFPL